ncbi:unannotated protein [freshwater metagenome]|uniref:Unannotated protein n=1 Tax=freshwater metagenome TaxID=449393 RepID=A0A6J7VBB0_9ZZZZ
MPRVDSNVRELLADVLDEFNSLFDGEERLLRVVNHDRHHDFVVEGASPLNNVEVTVGDGVEGPWADCASLHK